MASVSTQIHKFFKPYFTLCATEGAKASADRTILKRLTFIAELIEPGLPLGLSFADAYFL
jgi:hypothetical protein